MAQMPLFPHSSVLFPGMMLPLNITDERLRAMVDSCVNDKSPFGVVLKAGEQAGSIALPQRVGTTAHILECDRLNDGSMNVIVVGRQRFYLQRVLAYEPHLVGDVTFYPLRAGDAQTLRRNAGRVHRLMTGYVDLLLKTSGVELRLESLPTSPPTLATLTAIVLQVNATEKQALLEISTYEQLLESEEALLRRERALLTYMLNSVKPPKGDDPFRPTFGGN